MEFHMPLHEVKVGDFNRIINQYFKQHKRDYQFEQLNGMIKGFIDLMFEFEGKFYVFGGRRIQPTNIYDPKTNTWTNASPPPMEIHHFQPVIIGDEIWLFGTMTGEFPREVPLKTVYIYHPATDTWKEGPKIPQARRRGGAGCVLHTDGWISNPWLKIINWLKPIISKVENALKLFF